MQIFVSSHCPVTGTLGRWFAIIIIIIIIIIAYFNFLFFYSKGI